MSAKIKTLEDIIDRRELILLIDALETKIEDMRKRAHSALVDDNKFVHKFWTEKADESRTLQMDLRKIEI